jgi:hypothetical protein
MPSKRAREVYDPLKNVQREENKKFDDVKSFISYKKEIRSAGK